MQFTYITLLKARGMSDLHKSSRFAGSFIIATSVTQKEFRLDFLLIDRQTLSVEIDRCFYLPPG